MEARLRNAVLWAGDGTNVLVCRPLESSTHATSGWLLDSYHLRWYHCCHYCVYCDRYLLLQEEEGCKRR